MVRLAEIDATSERGISLTNTVVARRAEANQVFFAREADHVAHLCADMAARFAAGGRLMAIGRSGAESSDVRHVAVEFVHPVIVGKRALPAIGITGEAGAAATRVEMLARPNDMVIGFGDQIAGAVAAANARGCLTIAFGELGATHEFQPTGDAFARQELVETLYHVLWELVHVFFEHGEGAPTSAHPGQSAFLYPFLTDVPRDRDALLRDVAQSVVWKARDAAELRAKTLDSAGMAGLVRCANECRERLGAAGTVLAFGNGGSATDAMDLVADLREPPRDLEFASRRALDLTDDPSILTALSNDVGPDLIFARQVDTYGRAGDIAVAFSTSGSSRNVIAGLEAARRRGMMSIAFTGYDGGRIAADGFADSVINAPSQHVPRIQEAHATAYHVLRSLIG